MTPQRISDDPSSPFGFDEDGTVIAPFGFKANGDPRLSNRGRQAGDGFGTTTKKKAPAPPRKKKTVQADTSADRAGGRTDYRVAATSMLKLATMLPTMLGSDPGGMISRFIGKKQTLALKGDATIMHMYAEPLGSAIGGMAVSHPKLATFLEGGSIKKEVVVLATTVAQFGVSLLANHRAPSEELASMGDQFTALQAQAIKQEIQDMIQAGQEAVSEDDQVDVDGYDDLQAHVDEQRAAYEQRPAPAFVSDFATAAPGEVPGHYEHLAAAS